MSESIKTLLMSALGSNDTPADTDTMIVANGNTLEKITIAKLADFWKSKLRSVGYSEITFSSSTVFSPQGLNYAIYTNDICYVHLAYRLASALSAGNYIVNLPVKVKSLTNIAVFNLENDIAVTLYVDSSNGLSIRSGSAAPVGKYAADLIFQRV